MTEFSIIGATLYGNRGAEAMLSTVIGRLKECGPDSTFNVYTYYPDEDKRICDSFNINLFSAAPVYLVLILFPSACFFWLLKIFRIKFLAKLVLPKSIIALERSDVLIDIAGVSFMDGRVKFLPYNIITILIALIVKTPVVKFAQAMGSFHSPVVSFSARIILSKCIKIFARGKRTEDNLKTLKLPNRIVDIAADVVFLHKNEYSLSSENQEHINVLFKQMEEITKKGKKLIGVSPSSVMAAKARNENWNYYQFLGDCVYRLNEMGHAVLLFPNATREQSLKLRNNDLPVIEKTARYLAAFHQYPEDLVLVKNDMNTVCIKTIMEYCDLILASRFHAMVASLTMAKPVVVIGWSHKYMEVMQQFGLEEYVFDYKNNSVELLLDKVEHAMNNHKKIKTNIENRLPIVQNCALKQFKFVMKMIDKNYTHEK